MTRASLAVLVALLGCAGEPVVDDSDDDTGDSDPGCQETTAEFDFDSGEQGFEGGGTDPGFANPWAYGTPVEGCQTGASCWSTHPEGEYANCEAGAVTSPVIDLTGCAYADNTLQVSFWHVYRLESASSGTIYDGALVEVSGDGGSSWLPVTPQPAYDGPLQGNYSECEGAPAVAGSDVWGGNIPSGDWTLAVIDLDAAVRPDAFRVRFSFATDRGVTARGWTVDDVRIVAF